MKYFIPMKKDGTLDITEKQLKELLADTYQEGYSQGKIDQILNNSPDFAICENREPQKKRVFAENGKMLFFRATIV